LNQYEEKPLMAVAEDGADRRIRLCEKALDAPSITNPYDEEMQQ